ncbi:hypothetical protein [uncultured Paraglaciecola sp.]|uniref:hypothetical protein n=1 Tax=uncultured Paraglaciecola sp. TaxID=1765024 RepID=UPI0025F77A0D|nr:hypothetical protein [uncultured Paraglaciecola sp.]
MSDSDVYSAPAADLKVDTENNSGMGKGQALPDNIKGWSWGAFFLSWIWAIGNKTWIGLIAFVPYIGFIMAIVLGFKGREWAWQNKTWKSVEHFQEVQRRWSFWGVLIVLSFVLIGIIAAIAIPAYVEYQSKLG